MIGKGEPLYYINGRKVHDLEELKRLKSQDILDVEVISSPGAAYDASVSAVVKIKTRRKQWEGLSGSFNLGDAQALKYGNNNLATSLNLNYRKSAVDVFGGISLNKDYLDYYRSDMEINTYGVTAVHTQSGSFISQQKFARMHFNAGVNRQISDNSSMGAKLERGVWLKNYFRLTTEQDIERDGVMEDYLKSVSDKKNDRVGETLVGYTRTVESVTENSNHLFAARLVADRALWLGNLKLGGELTAVRRSNEYAISGVETMGGRTSNVREQTYAAFADYGLMIPRAGMLTLGIRYEHVNLRFNDFIVSKVTREGSRVTFFVFGMLFIDELL